MRILILNYEFPPLGGGGGAAARDLALGFIKNGHQVDCLTSGFKNLSKQKNIEGINVFRTRAFGRKEMATANNLSMASFLFFAFFKGLSLCRKNNYNLINTHFVLPTGPLGFLLSKIFRIKNILTMHGGDIYDPSLKRSPHRHWLCRKVIRFLVEKSDFAVTESNHNKENILKYYHPKKEIVVIAHPYRKFVFSPKSRNELGLADEKKYLISVGRLVLRKGYEYLIEALSFIKDNNAELIIIGNGPEKDNLEKIAKDVGIEKRVRIKSGLDNEEKFQYLAASDIYVLSSIHEGFGIVLQEAMQAGLPIVATNYGGQVDLIEDGENGFLVEPKSAEKLAEKIKFLLSNELLANEIAERNKREVEKYDYKKIAQEYLGLRE